MLARSTPLGLAIAIAITIAAVAGLSHARPPPQFFFPDSGPQGLSPTPSDAYAFEVDHGQIALLGDADIDDQADPSYTPHQRPAAASCDLPSSTLADGSAPYWLETIKHQGRAAFLSSADTYPVFRNVKDYGAKGDGSTDDTAAINNAIQDGTRCYQACGSSSTSPALVYFPSGTYVISSPILAIYYTQLVGDARNLPVILASSNFTGSALIDADPPNSSGSGDSYTSQDNFYRQVRNIVIDTRSVPPTTAINAIHWEVAQATSLSNLVLHLSSDTGTVHRGVYVDQGSGGWMSDLVITGGQFGMSVGSQQFTVRNVSITDALVGVHHAWGWGWTYIGMNIHNATTAAFTLTVSADGTNQNAPNTGSIVVVDSAISSTPVAVRLSTTSSGTADSVILDNVSLDDVPAMVSVQDSGQTIAAGTTGKTTVASWSYGHVYQGDQDTVQVQAGPLTPPNKPSALLSGAKFFTRPRPLYDQYSVKAFVSARDSGAKGDGVTDDTSALNAALSKAACNSILFLDAGTYLVTDTVQVPVGSRIVGEVWSVIQGTGSNFADAGNVRPIVRVGSPGDVGVVEISDVLVSTRGPTPGAVLIEWNVAQDVQGSAGMWDSHVRVGGAAGTQLRAGNCGIGKGVTANCTAAALNLWLRSGSSAYIENSWIWVADHDLDEGGQISVFNGRGVLVESAGPTWLYGTASEHSQRYQYNLHNAHNVLLAMIQTETPYWENTPDANQPFAANATWGDPTFADCSSSSSSPPCAKAWGFRAANNSTDVLLYGAGLYSFFDNYDQSCRPSATCQSAIVDLQSSSVAVYGLNTVGTADMIDRDGTRTCAQADNAAGFTSVISAYLNSL